MLLLLMAAGRSFTTADYGLFTVAITLATVAEVFMDFGLHQVSIRMIAGRPAEAGRIFRTSLALKVLPGVGMMLVFGALAFYLRPEPEARWACILMLGSAVMRSYLLTARGVMQGLERFGHDALATTADRALLLAGCLAAFWWHASLVQVSVVFLLVRTVTAAGAVLLASRGIEERVFDQALWNALPAQAIPVGIFLLVLNVYNRVDTLMLARMTDPVQTAYYTSAYTVYEGLTYGAAAVSAVLAPRFARLWLATRSGYRGLAIRSLVAACVLGVLVAAVSWPLCRPVLDVAFPDMAAPSTPTLRWLVLGLPAIYGIWILHAIAISAAHSRSIVTVTAAGAALNVALNLVLIPRYTHAGAAVATVISECIVGAMLLVALRKVIAGSPKAERA